MALMGDIVSSERIASSITLLENIMHTRKGALLAVVSVLIVSVTVFLFFVFQSQQVENEEHALPVVPIATFSLSYMSVFVFKSRV